MSSVKDYKVLSLVNDDNDDKPIDQVDFKRDLKTDKAFDKKVTMSADGRPLHAEYYESSVLMAKIYFYFIVNADGLITRRTEELHYIKSDDTEGIAIRIKDKTYDLADSTDLSFVLQERMQGRQAIIDEIKAVILQVLSAANPTKTIDEVIDMGIPFFDEQDTNIKHFTDLGTSSFRDAVVAIDLQTTAHDWLAEEVAPNYTLQDHIVAKLTYTSTSNHPDA